MEKILSYKGYEGSAEVDMDSMVCRGKILFIDDLITYQADSPKKLLEAFKSAVDDYSETCALLKREPLKPLKGLFNVRVSPSLHKTLVIRALNEKASLNEVVVRALTAYVSVQPAQINHTQNLFSVHVAGGEEPARYVVSGKQEPVWTTVATPLH